MQSRHSG